MYDLIVCGGGPAGTAAAVATARRGLQVLLIERYGFAGGMATSALVNPWMGHAFREKTTGRAGSLIEGVFKEVVSRLKEAGGYGSKLCPAAFDEERLKIVYDDMLREAGVEVRFHTLLAGAERDGPRLKSVTTFSKSGREEYGAKYFIDSTGDGDLAAFAGCGFSVGRPEDNLTQAMTVCFRMAGVDKSAMLAQAGLKAARMLVEPYFQKARGEGALEYPYRDFVHFYDYPRPGVLHFNMTRINRASGLSAQDLTRAEMEGRRQAALISGWLVKEVPYFKGAYLEKIACQAGVRETRHIKGAYAMAMEDITSGRKFSDAIVRSAYFIDIHSPTGSGFAHEKEGEKGAVKRTYAPPPGDYYEVPYRALLPEGMDNLLVACRALSATHEGAAAVRVMATMTGIGEAAGLAASEACGRSLAFGKVDGARLRGELGYLDRKPDYSDLWQVA